MNNTNTITIKGIEFIHVGACVWEEKVRFFALVGVEELECFIVIYIFTSIGSCYAL